MDTITTKNNIEILEAESQADINAFIRLPFEIYKDDPNWVPPLISERKVFFNKKKNPFYRSAKTRLFLARQNGRYVGRIATCLNYSYNEFHEAKTGFYGFFDFFENYEVAELLFRVALITIKKDGMEKMVGPANFSTNHEVGLLVEGFDRPPMIMMTYNKPYYVEFAERLGLTKEMDLLAFRIDENSKIDPRVVRIAERIRQRENVKLRTLDMKNFSAEVDLINEIYNKAWAKNWGFAPMSPDEFRHIAKDMKQIVDPNVVFIAEIDNRPVGFCLALPDFNQVLKYTNGRLFPTGLIKLLWHTKVKNKIDSLRVITMGVAPEFQKRGIETLLYLEIIEKGPTLGYRWAEMSWILENNISMVKACEALGSDLYKRYRMYSMKV